MDSTTEPVRSSSERIAERTAELDRLIKSFRGAQNSGNRADALRLIDRAWRIAPINPEINHLYGLFLLSEGQAEHAIPLLNFAAADTASAGIDTVRISALLRAGQTVAAQRLLETTLRRFAVEPGQTLAQTARQVVTASMPDITGWVGIGPDLELYGEIAALGSGIHLTITGQSGATLEHDIASTAKEPFAEFSIPVSHALIAPGATVRADKGRLLGEAVALPRDFGFDGRITTYADAISGWATLGWYPGQDLALTVSNENGFSADLDTVRDPDQPDRTLFTLNPDLAQRVGNAFSITARMPNGRILHLPGSPFLVRPPDVAKPPGLAAPVALSDDRPAVDIVIPVYSGMAETLACIRSVQRSTAGSNREIVVIDDASIDPRLGPALDALSRAGAITLLRNPVNLGFPESVNRGFALHPDRDIVILNADTEVYGDWLQRLQKAAYSDPAVGTVTPLTNSGTIASYPASEGPPLKSGLAAERDRQAAAANAGITIEIPTGVGFCLYVRRDCLNAIGYFDSTTFGAGYGEENDLCLRATAAGWRHLLTGEVYVSHVGGRSFGSRRAGLFERNIRLLNLRHPGYNANIQAFIARDLAHPMRRRLDEAQLRASHGPFVLLVNIGRGGGVDRSVQDRVAEYRKGKLKPIVIKPDVDHEGRWTLIVDEGEFQDLYYDGAEDIDSFIALLSALPLDHVEIHHFLDLPPEAIERILDLGYPVDIHIHDYVWYCPRINLIDGSRRYCGEPAPTACQVCVDQNGSQLSEDISVAALRDRSARWLGAARRLVVPAPSVAARMHAQFPQLRFAVEPLEPAIAATPIRPQSHPRRKIALIGAIGMHKGYDILLNMAQDAARRDLPLDFVVIGYTADDKALFATGRVFITGEFREPELEQLIAREKPDMALFLSQFPESWCYALTHALNAKIPVGGVDFGAIADRLRTLSPEPLLFPLSAAPAEICDLLVSAFAEAAAHDGNEASRLRESGIKASVVDSKPAIVIQAFMPPESAKISRRHMATPGNPPVASLDFLPLTKGMFLVSVKPADTPTRIDATTGLTLPATQLSTMPGADSGHIEFLSGPETPSTWLSKPSDQIIVKVLVPSSVLLITSVTVEGLPALDLEIARLDRPEAAGVQPAAQRVTPPLPAMPDSIKLTVVTHIQNRGDTAFSESQWAGVTDEPFWIESFSVMPLESIAPEMIEYKGITSTGVETPWVSGGNSCGTRGISVPLIAFAIRAKPHAGAKDIVCEYGAVLLSGTVIGPARNGAPCRSGDANDPINAIWVSISGAADTQVPVPPQPVEPAAAEAPTTAKKDKRPVGPRFSALREPS